MFGILLVPPSDSVRYLPLTVSGTSLRQCPVPPSDGVRYFPLTVSGRHLPRTVAPPVRYLSTSFWQCPVPAFASGALCRTGRRSVRCLRRCLCRARNGRPPFKLCRSLCDPEPGGAPDLTVPADRGSRDCGGGNWEPSPSQTAR